MQARPQERCYIGAIFQGVPRVHYFDGAMLRDIMLFHLHPEFGIGWTDWNLADNTAATILAHAMPFDRTICIPFLVEHFAEEFTHHPRSDQLYIEEYRIVEWVTRVCKKASMVGVTRCCLDR